MKGFLLVGTALFAPLAFAQGAPVTLGEANAAMSRVDAAIRKVLKMPADTVVPGGSSVPVTRSQVIARLDAMFESYRSQFKITPRPFRTEAQIAARFNKDAKTLSSIEKLARFGCIGPVGPLVVGPAETILPSQLGDALGLFLSQIAALTYTADPKWTPALQPPDVSGGGGSPGTFR